MISGNKGEWSELYVFLRLLADGKMYAADSDLERIDNAYSIVQRVIRHENGSDCTEYVLNKKKDEIDLYHNGDRIKTLQTNRIATYAEALYSGILKGKKASFPIEGADQIMQDIRCNKIKAPSEDKTDITIEIHDRKTGYNSVVGYSIKSELGNAPTLLNASRATNFRYEITGISDGRMNEINMIDTKAKIRDRICALENSGSIRFDKCINSTFSGNLMLIDSLMEEIISNMLIEYYKNSQVNCADITTEIEQKDPLGYHREGVYRYKIKKFLCAVALGMMPSKKWDGRDEANGGYIIVKESGEVLAYHLYNRNAFENYLLNNTKFETASSTRHRFGAVYKEGGHYYFNLNLQVRFV